MIMYSCPCGMSHVNRLDLGEKLTCLNCGKPVATPTATPALDYQISPPIERTLPIGGPVQFVVDRCLACTALEQRVARLEAQLLFKAHSQTDHEAEYIKQFAPCGNCGAMGCHLADCPVNRQ